jgi:hypothetical protein
MRKASCLVEILLKFLHLLVLLGDSTHQFYLTLQTHIKTPYSMD